LNRVFYVQIIYQLATGSAPADALRHLAIAVIRYYLSAKAKMTGCSRLY